MMIMAETIAPFIAYALALGIAGAIPGPGIAAVVGRSFGVQRHSALPFIFGIAVGDVVFLTIAVLGLSFVAQIFAGVFTAIKVGGGLYLLYLAWKFWTANVEKTDVDHVVARAPWVAVLSGMAISLGNPKVIVFYLALLPNVIDLTAVTILDWSVLSVITVAVLFVVLLPYSIAASQLRQVFSNKVALRRLNRGAALFIGGAGSLILVDAARSR